jgi:sigma-B regulation protein RsbU (phosphoserine phosphatase)
MVARGETVNEKPRILIVDDTPGNIKVLHNLLREDYALSVATSGAAALEIAFSDDCPDLVLLDVMMPEMDGHEVCRRLKADSRTRDVPVIFVTAMSEVEDETKGFGLGAVDYITKPVRPPIVEARVATHLELARTRQVLARQNAAMRGDLALAARVQESLLPKTLPAFPGLDLAYYMCPSDAVGGDYLDLLSDVEFGGRGLGVVVGDISGHGPASALLMTAARAILRIRATQPGSLAEIVADLNRRLASDVGGTGKFMTFFLAQVDAGVVTWVRAGNEPGLLLDPATGEITELVGDGMVLGIMPNEEFEELSVPFSSPGSVLAVVTDGITEAMDASDDMFGRDRLDTSLRKYCGCSAQGIVDGVLADVAAFRGDAAQNDDVTLAIVKRT